MKCVIKMQLCWCFYSATHQATKVQRKKWLPFQGKKQTVSNFYLAWPDQMATRSKAWWTGQGVQDLVQLEKFLDCIKVMLLVTRSKSRWNIKRYDHCNMSDYIMINLVWYHIGLNTIFQILSIKYIGTICNYAWCFYWRGHCYKPRQLARRANLLWLKSLSVLPTDRHHWIYIYP